MSLSRFSSVAKCTTGLVFLGLLFYVLNYLRLSSLPSKPIDQLAAIDFNTAHSPYPTRDCIPENRDIKGFSTRISNDIPHMGTHYLLLNRFFAGDDLPKGYMMHDGKLVGYFYSSHDPNCHTHIHKNLCLMEGLVPTTKFSRIQCLEQGYFFFSRDSDMLHVWLKGPVNEEYASFF